MKASITTALALGLLVAALTAGAGAAGATGVAGKSGCDTGAVKGADYVYKLSARNLSCGKAAKLATDFNKCRHDHGGPKGHCNSVDGYSCNQKKLDSSASLYQAKGVCKSGSKKFKEVYGEFT